MSNSTLNVGDGRLDSYVDAVGSLHAMGVGYSVGAVTVEGSWNTLWGEGSLNGSRGGKASSIIVDWIKVLLGLAAHYLALNLPNLLTYGFQTGSWPMRWWEKAGINRHATWSQSKSNTSKSRVLYKRLVWSIIQKPILFWRLQNENEHYRNFTVSKRFHWRKNHSFYYSLPAV